jgi:hypothetical protein
MVDPTGWLVEHADDGQFRVAQDEGWSNEARGDAVEHKYVRPFARNRGEHPRTVGDSERKCAIGKGCELEARIVSRREVRQAAMEQVTAGQPVRVAERYQDR